MKKATKAALVAISAILLPMSAHAALGTDWTEATAAAPWGVRQEQAAASFDGKLWVLGGNKSGTMHDVWSSPDGATWTEATSTAEWTAREDLGAVSFNNKLWIMGGADGFGGYLNDVWSSPDGATWTEATSTAEWTARVQFGTAVFDNKMWILGGSGGTALNDVWSSPDGVTWTEATSSAEWSARRQFGTAVFDNKLWIMGGVDGSGNYLNDVWSSPDGVTWTEATSSAEWSGRYSLGTGVLGGKFWVMGGLDAVSGPVNDVWSSPDGVTWTEATSSAGWAGRIFLTSAVLNDKLWIMGGNGKQDVWYSNLSYALSFDTQGGSSVAALPDETAGASVTLPAAPSRAGYDFQDWNTASDGSGTSYAAGASYTMPPSDTTLFAVWEQEAAPPQSSHSSSHPGTSVQAQIQNLESMGNTSAADALKAQWPQLSIASTGSANAAVNASTTLSVRDLEFGMVGDDVALLQKFLNANGATVAASGPGSSGSETTYFGPLTEAALAKYQAANGIMPAAGYFGPITRAHIASTGGAWW